MPQNLGSVATGAGAAATVNASHTLVAGNNRIVIAWCSSEYTPDTNHVSVYYDTGGDNVAMTKITGAGGAADNGPECRGSMWYLLEADIPSSTGAKNVRLTAAHICDGLGITVWAISNAKQVAPEDSDVSTSTSTLYLSGTVFSSGGAYTVCGSAHSVRSSGTTPDSPQIELSDFDDNGARNATSYIESNPSGDNTLGHTSSGTNNLMVCGVASFAHLGGGGFPVAITPVLMI
jgi:hypothetical protein